MQGAWGVCVNMILEWVWGKKGDLSMHMQVRVRLAAGQQCWSLGVLVPDPTRRDTTTSAPVPPRAHQAKPPTCGVYELGAHALDKGAQALRSAHLRAARHVHAHIHARGSTRMERR